MRTVPLPAKGQNTFSLEVDTKSIQGEGSLFFEINPNEDQAELTHFNNYLNWDFYIEGDDKGPVLDVTFDGIQILDGDIISPEALILIQLKDENPYVPLSDTSLVEIQLEYPDGQIERFYADDARINFIPEFTAGKNELRIEMEPDLDQDGTYKLTVRAEDVAGNKSGLLPYQVSFEVINKNMISNVFNYPNPFSTSTQFVYTLTGRVPTQFGIQIATVSGRIVREIGADEIGELRVGTHRTPYQWDGTDEFGDQLANGVYLYRVVAKDELGTDYEKFENNTNQFFQKGWGKMVILR
ncbi:MAG: hypothetical protein F6K19_20160 [Cyanothece sp. SIO1E1]|nr:hypothetical protein [Cyanothece sp. SIO1E1]